MSEKAILEILSFPRKEISNN